MTPEPRRTLTDIHPDLPPDRDAVDMILDIARVYNLEVSGAHYDVRGNSPYLDGIRDAFVVATGLGEGIDAEVVLDDLAMYVNDLDHEDEEE